MLDKQKTDPILGKKVHAHFESLGIETPMSNAPRKTDEEKIDIIKNHFSEIMVALGLDLEDDSLFDTPKRVAKMFVNEVFWGLDYANFPKITTVANKAGYHDLLVEKCTIKSNCEHHFVYFGTSHNPDKLGCWVSYIPKDKVLGLSKINRLVEFFSRRPQIQERLNDQIAEALKFILDTDDVAVVIRSQHFCVLTRGVEDADSYTVTSSLHGKFMDNQALRQELMAIVNR